MIPLPKDLLANPRLSRWVRINTDGTVAVRTGKVELGQGILTALAQVAADALGVPFGCVVMLPANTAEGPDEGWTAGSMSVADAGPAVRIACANVRALCVAEAAAGWGVATDQVTVDAGGRIVAADGRWTTYGALADRVVLDVDARPDIASDTALGPGTGVLGTSIARIDLPAKVTGRARYIGDLRLPGQLFGRVVRPPSPGARLESVPGLAIPNVTTVRDGSFLGVVGPDESVVERAAEELRDATSWAECDTLPDEDDLVGYLRAGPHETTAVVDEETDDTVGLRTVRARYSRPFLAHASIAPSCGIARWDAAGEHLMVWSHSQGIRPLRDAIAAALTIDVERVTVEHAENAGCYGHNAADDAAFDAVLLARAVPGRPVQVRWSRRDELTWAPFGSAMAVEVAASLDDAGRIRSWTYDVWSQGHLARPGYSGVPGLLAATHLELPFPSPAAADPPLAGMTGGARNALPPYDVGRRRISAHRLLETPIRSSSLRALGAYTNVFAIESFLDELAATAGEDPLEFRLRALADDRARTVLEKAASEAGWGRPLPEGTGHGLGFARYKNNGAYCAVVAEVEAEHEIRVRRLTVAVDVGRVINPDGVRNQIEGGAVQATSWTLKERVRFDRRRITSDDWESYPILRFSEVPRVDVHLVDRPDEPSVGSGEAVAGPATAAIGNAVARAVGVRVRDLPITVDAVVAAIEREPR